ncbi:1-deoxy-D-xylulose-5-phosphate synthase [Reinekea sp. G2M2-21]|uniref:1-deoxy-D-xylulose-5-phosphate synthase n=1 Tax=Reinekea sp. G2M2-21 TaxID=2788942 RepID=UPI001E4EF4F4|nr:1-deoxy-D-xylulose-5-phosphate synthase [Reinekea sp. G2M2-21]
MKLTDREIKIEYMGMKLDQDLIPPKEFRAERSRIMYIEDKSGGLQGPARIGRVYFSKSGKTLYYRGSVFQSLKGSGYKSNYYEVESGDEYWISGPRKDQNNRLYGGNRGVEVDEDVAEEYAKLIKNA